MKKGYPDRGGLLYCTLKRQYTSGLTGGLDCRKVQKGCFIKEEKIGHSSLHFCGQWAEIPVFSKIRTSMGIFDGVFSVRQILKLLEGLFREKIEKRKQ